jgi:hypothetical protein
VILVLPILLDISANRGLYIFMAESFAILAECFLLVWVSKPKYELNLYRDLTVVAVANLTSFIAGEIWWWQ